jgi:hypothetical protein
VRFSGDRACWLETDLAIEKDSKGNYSAIKGGDPTETIIGILQHLDSPAYLNLQELKREVMRADSVKETAAEERIYKARKEAASIIGWRGRGRETLYYHRSNEPRMQAEFDQGERE